MDETGEVSERRPGPVALRRPNATQVGDVRRLVRS